jgi:hypothetical protein
VHVVENWLRGELTRLKPSQLAMHDETNRLFHAVARGAGQKELMELTGWNERKIQRLFLTRFGASAATIRRLSRFRRSLTALESEIHPSRASASADLGATATRRTCAASFANSPAPTSDPCSRNVGVSESFKRRASELSDDASGD